MAIKSETEFTISNIAGGDLKTFKLCSGGIPDTAIRHADRIGFGGALFGGPAADEASRLYDLVCEDREHAR